MTQDEIENEHSKKCTWLKFGCGKVRVEINPIVTAISSVVIWGAVVYCMVKPEHAFATLEPWMPWITETWTWLYIVTQDIWFLVILAVGVMKYGSLRLGKDNEKPEYPNSTYFCMLFAAGVGIGLFYYGVAEPIFHYKPGTDGNRYYERYNDNLMAQDAINVTFFHWGIHGWIAYVLVGLVMALVSYRMGMVMCVRSCFYPIIGERIYGIFGDMIDALSCICTMFGVCTSLGLGTVQLNAGLYRMNNSIEENTKNQVIIIWAITFVATISVVSGVKLGIRRLSEICFALGIVILLIVILYDDTWYLLNVVVQSTGYYLQNIIQLGFHTDAFAQMENSIDGRDASTWLGSWTIFYFGWWIAWAPFVGMFIAKVSRGRTVKEFIMYTMTIPVLYCFLWFGVFGAVAIKMEREAFWNNITCNSPMGGKGATEPGPNNLYRLSCRGTTDMWFDVVGQYEGLGGFLSVLSIASLVLYFVTSSDSGSLVIDSLSANGHPDPPRLQRIFWAITEGACATGLLVAGGAKALNALQSAAIASGLVYTIILNFMSIALWRLVKIESKELDPKGPQFTMDLLGVFYNIKHFIKFLVAIFAPWYFVGRANAILNKSRIEPIFTMIILAILYYGHIALRVLEIVHPGLSHIGTVLYIGYATYTAGIRIQMRETYNINGNMVEDFFAMFFGSPAAAVQMDDHMAQVPLPQEGLPMTDLQGHANGNADPKMQSYINDYQQGVGEGHDNMAFTNQL